MPSYGLLFAKYDVIHGNGSRPTYRIATLPDEDRATAVDKKSSPSSITERRVPELIPVLASPPTVDVNHKHDGRLPLLSVRPTKVAGLSL